MQSRPSSYHVPRTYIHSRAVGYICTSRSYLGRSYRETIFLPRTVVGIRSRCLCSKGILRLVCGDDFTHVLLLHHPSASTDPRSTWVEHTNMMGYILGIVEDMATDLQLPGRMGVVILLTTPGCTVFAHGDHLCEPVGCIWQPTRV